MNAIEYIILVSILYIIFKTYVNKLYLCFINDLHTVTDLLTLLFADDTAGLKSGLNLNELITKVNTEVNKLANWFRANKMAVNVSKTKYIIFKPKGVKINIGDTTGIVYDENEIGMTKDAKKSPRLLESTMKALILVTEPINSLACT